MQLRDKSPPPPRELTHFSNQAIHIFHVIDQKPQQNPTDLDDQSMYQT